MNFHGIYFAKETSKLPKLSPMLLNSERRSGYGNYGAHPGVNSIYVGKDDSGILWPLLGLFGLFQLLTTGAIAYKAFSGANFTVNYTLPATNVNRNFSVVNTVVAPATATATNENQDNDVISNTATNAGGRRKRKKAQHTIFYDE